MVQEFKKTIDSGNPQDIDTINKYRAEMWKLTRNFFEEARARIGGTALAPIAEVEKFIEEHSSE